MTITIEPPRLDYTTDDDVDDRLNPSAQGRSDSSTQLSISEQAALDQIERDLERTSHDSSGVRDNQFDYRNNGAYNASQGVTDQEEYASSWQTRVGSSRRQQKPNNKQRLGAFLRKRSATTVVVGLGLVLIIAIGGSFSVGSLLLNIKELIVERHDLRAIDADHRSGQLLAKRLGEAGTRGCSGPVRVTCKFTRPSNKLIKNLAKAGIKAVDNKGNTIDKQGWLAGKTRPSKYILPDGKEITARGFRTELANNPWARSAFRRAYNPRWAVWSDKVAKRLFKDLGLSKSLPKDLEKADSAEKAKEAAGKASKGENMDKDHVKAAIEKEAKGFSKKNIKGIRKIFGNIASPGQWPLVAARSTCLASAAPGMVVKIIRDYQYLQFAKYAMIFLVAADSIKAGEADPKIIGALGALLTTPVNGKSAMDSFGMRNSLMGDTNPKGDAYKKYVPSADRSLSGLIQMRNDPNIKQICALANSTEADVAAQIADKTIKLTNPAGWVALGLNGVIWVLEKTGTLDKLVAPIFEKFIAALMENLPIDEILKSVLGDLTANVIGEAAGDVITAGATGLMVKMASRGAGGALTKQQRKQHAQLIANPIRLAWAEEDRATRSPLDASSPHTFLGSIYRKLIPYYSSISTVTGTLAAFNGLFSSSLSSLIRSKTSAAANFDDREMEMCPDPLIQNNNIASSAFCGVYYGMSPQYANLDIEDISMELLSKGQIDNDGNIKEGSELAERMQTCRDDDTTALAECKVETREAALYHLYQSYSDDADMQDDEGSEREGASDSNNNSGPATDKPSRDGWVKPIDAAPGFGWHAQGKKGLHKALDFPAPAGTPVMAAHDGTITKQWDMGSCGWATVITAEGVPGIWHIYQHADPLPEAKVGTVVKRGQVIARVGRFCGSATHLHFGIETANRVSIYTDSGSQDTSRDPKDYIPL